MIAIRLTRIGKKNSPAYRVVVADKRRAVKRKFIEIIGNYNPTMKPKTVVIDKERALFWMNLGAQPSDTVRNLMCDLGVLDKKEKLNKVYGKKLSKKAIKEGGETEPAGQSSLGGAETKAAAVAEGVAETETPEEPTVEAKSAIVEEVATEEAVSETEAVVEEATSEEASAAETEVPAEAKTEEPATEEAPTSEPKK